MRVISGSARGIALKSPPEGTRPTVDRVKEALFGIIQFEIAGANVLDLFAGSGALGIESLSRGAEKCIFVDNSQEAINIIKGNLKSTRVSGAEVLKMQFDAALRSFNEKFDFIFMDPPYDSGFYTLAAKIIKERDLLSEGGRIIAEHDKDIDIDCFSKLKSRKYGRTYISIFG